MGMKSKEMGMSITEIKDTKQERRNGYQSELERKRLGYRDVRSAWCGPGGRQPLDGMRSKCLDPLATCGHYEYWSHIVGMVRLGFP